jgi:hypothetical protein
VLALFAPFVGNPPQPVAYLFRDCGDQTDIPTLSPSNRPDLTALAREADIVVNLKCDVDQGAAVLPLADEIARCLGKPVINEPEKVLRTTRDATAVAPSLRAVVCRAHCALPQVTCFCPQGAT